MPSITEILRGKYSAQAADQEKHRQAKLEEESLAAQELSLHKDEALVLKEFLVSSGVLGLLEEIKHNFLKDKGVITLTHQVIWCYHAQWGYGGDLVRETSHPHAHASATLLWPKPKNPRGVITIDLALNTEGAETFLVSSVFVDDGFNDCPNEYRIFDDKSEFFKSEEFKVILADAFFDASRSPGGL